MKSILYSIIAIFIYRLIESIDGEKNIKLIDYRIAEKIKIKCYDYIK